MSKSENFRNIRICLSFGLFICFGGVATAQGPGSPFDTANILHTHDRNNNGRLDPDEIQAMPDFTQRFLTRGGIDPARGASRDEIEQAMQTARERFQQSGTRFEGRMEGRNRHFSSIESVERRDSNEGGFDRRRFEGRREWQGDDRGDDSQRRDRRRDWNAEGQRTAALPASAAPQRVHGRVTVDLPKTYEEADLDQDGQISFYEWRQWKQGTYSEFLTYDQNNDGFLTPRELMKSPQAQTGTANAAPNAPSSTRGSGDSGSSGPRGRSRDRRGPPEATSSSATTSTTNSGSDQVSGAARSRFRLLDKNRDGMIDTNEWNSSQRIRKALEEAKVDLSKPMSLTEFAGHMERLKL